MTAELIVMIFNQNGETRDVWRALENLHKARDIGLKNAVLVERDASGKAFIQQHSHFPTWDRAFDDSFILLFTNALFTEDAETHKRELIASVFDECFVGEFEKAWQPNSSAMVIYIPRNSLVNSQRLLDYLSEYSGTLMYTTLPEQVIDSILELSRNEAVIGFTSPVEVPIAEG